MALYMLSALSRPSVDGMVSYDLSSSYSWMLITMDYIIRKYIVSYFGSFKKKMPTNILT